MRVTKVEITTDPMDNCHLCKNKDGNCSIKRKVKSLLGLKIIVIQCPEFEDGKQR